MTLKFPMILASLISVLLTFPAHSAPACPAGGVKVGWEPWLPYAYEEQGKFTGLDLDMATDIRAAAASEDIKNTLDYKAVSKRLIGFIEEAEFLLIETMAERVAEIVLDEFPVCWLRLRLGKPGAVTGARDVGVIIERGDRPAHLPL